MSHAHLGLLGLLATTALISGCATMGAELMILIFIVVIIGGLGSVGGCFVAALLVGLTSNYVGFLAPKVALGSTILLMMLVLLWRPAGLYPVARR